MVFLTVWNDSPRTQLAGGRYIKAAITVGHDQCCEGGVHTALQELRGRTPLPPSARAGVCARNALGSWDRAQLL